MLQLHVRNLGPDDAASFRALRLRGLQEYPQAFGSSYEEERHVTLESDIAAFASRVAPHNFIAGAFLKDGSLVGMIGFVQQQKNKLKHKGMIWGMYVIPELHGTGAGSKLMQHLIDEVKRLPEVTQIQLAVVTTNEPAKRLYERKGFQVYGVEKDALRVDGIVYDEYLMALYL
ncbi:acetyltransferase (GNAT) family protein [Tumebacillus sp. BK434]|nr:acetyltransferase (GNAT) family protein [Tumebacillus sp. BK434]